MDVTVSYLQFNINNQGQTCHHSTRRFMNNLAMSITFVYNAMPTIYPPSRTPNCVLYIHTYLLWIKLRVKYRELITAFLTSNNSFGINATVFVIAPLDHAFLQLATALISLRYGKMSSAYGSFAKRLLLKYVCVAMVTIGRRTDRFQRFGAILSGVFVSHRLKNTGNRLPMM